MTTNKVLRIDHQNVAGEMVAGVEFSLAYPLTMLVEVAQDFERLTGRLARVVIVDKTRDDVVTAVAWPPPPESEASA